MPSVEFFPNAAVNALCFALQIFGPAEPKGFLCCFGQIMSYVQAVHPGASHLSATRHGGGGQFGEHASG
jgi:hypothetical protein